MEENKQVTAEEIYMAVQERECPWRNNYILPDSWQLTVMEEYATLKTQQIEDENTREVCALCEVVNDLTAENERLKHIMLDAECLGVSIHDEVARLPISMEKYTPISKLLIDLKTLLREKSGNNTSPTSGN